LRQGRSPAARLRAPAPAAPVVVRPQDRRDRRRAPARGPGRRVPRHEEPALPHDRVARGPGDAAAGDGGRTALRLRARPPALSVARDALELALERGVGKLRRDAGNLLAGDLSARVNARFPLWDFDLNFDTY